jgi:hypothetical protein
MIEDEMQSECEHEDLVWIGHDRIRCVFCGQVFVICPITNGSTVVIYGEGVE